MLRNIDPATDGRLTSGDVATMTVTPSDTAGGALEAAEVARLARMAAEVGSVVDLVVEGAEIHGRDAAGAPVSRYWQAALLARDLRRAIDMSPEGWAVLVAELALRLSEQEGRR